MVQRLKVNQFHTTPSAIRILMKADNKYVKDYDLSSLKTIGSGVCIALKSFQRTCIQALTWYFKRVFTPAPFILLYGLCDPDDSDVFPTLAGGEPLSTAGWKWYFEVVGKGRCILVNNWGQTG